MDKEATRSLAAISPRYRTRIHHHREALTPVLERRLIETHGRTRFASLLVRDIILPALGFEAHEMATLRFMHTADWHLGAGFGAFPEDVASVRRRQQRECIEWLVARAIAPGTRVDVLLIAGDVFDSPKPSPSEVGFFESQLERLTEAGIQVFMIPGTGGHDAYRPSGLWDRMNLHGAHVFREGAFTAKPVAGCDEVTVWGAACDPGRPDQNLLAAAAHLSTSGLSIGLYHGGLAGRYEQEGEKGNAFVQGDVEHAPFSYLALGHYHRLAQVLDTPTRKAFYCGAPTATGFRSSELGGRFGITGELSEKGTVTVSPVELSFGIHRAEVLDCTRRSLAEMNEQFRQWADPNVYVTVSLKGVVTPDIMAHARELEQQHRDSYGYLRVSLEFEDLSGAEENEYLRLFRQRASEAVAQETDEERRALLREALVLGTEALLQGGGR
jgi:DNA repair exonuclease SbcCD nuclease subunit